MIEAVIAVVSGLLAGSFLNVCIYRLPRDLSVVRPRSHCTSCGHMISGYDNIPILSYLFLGRRCRHCRAAIPWRYPAVELVTAVLFLLGYLSWGPTPGAIKFAIFSALMVGMVVTDLETRLLPDEFTLGGFYTAIALSPIVLLNDGLARMFLPVSPPLASLVDAFLGAGFASGSLWLVGLLYNKVRHREGLGFGDVKLVAMMGAFLGLPGAMAAILVGCVAGSLLGLGYIVIRRKNAASYELPFGSFLGVAGILVALNGQGLLHWYSRL